MADQPSQPTVPDDAPDDVKAFVSCTGADLVIKVGTKIGWIEGFPAIEVKTMNVDANGAVTLGGTNELTGPVTATLTTPGGRLEAHITRKDEGQDVEIAPEQVSSWAKDLNEWFASKKKKLDKPVYDKTKQTITVHKSDGVAEKPPKATDKPAVKSAPSVLDLDLPQPQGGIFAPISTPVSTGETVSTGADDDDDDDDDDGCCFFRCMRKPVTQITTGVVVVGLAVGGYFVFTGNDNNKSTTKPTLISPSPAGPKSNTHLDVPYLKLIEGIPNPGLRDTYLKAAREGTLDTFAPPRLPAVFEHSDPQEPAKAATDPGTQLVALTNGIVENYVPNLFACGDGTGLTVACPDGQSGPPPGDKWVVFGAFVKSRPTADAQHQFNVGVALQDRTQTANFEVPSGIFSNDWDQFATSATQALGRPGGPWHVSYLVSNGRQLVRSNVPMRFILSGNYFGFGLPLSALTKTTGARWYVFKSDQNYGIGTHDWSGEYAPDLHSFIVDSKRGF